MGGRSEHISNNPGYRSGDRKLSLPSRKQSDEQKLLVSMCEVDLLSFIPLATFFLISDMFDTREKLHQVKNSLKSIRTRRAVSSANTEAHFAQPLTLCAAGLIEDIAVDESISSEFANI